MNNDKVSLLDVYQMKEKDRNNGCNSTLTKCNLSTIEYKNGINLTLLLKLLRSFIIIMKLHKTLRRQGIL